MDSAGTVPSKLRFDNKKRDKKQLLYKLGYFLSLLLFIRDREGIPLVQIPQSSALIIKREIKNNFIQA